MLEVRRFWFALRFILPVICTRKNTEIDNAATQIPAGTASIAIDFFFGFVFMFISLKYLMLLYKPKRYRNTLLNNVFAIINTKQFRDRGIVYKIHRFFNLGTLTIYSK